MVIMLIMRAGEIMDLGFEKAFLLQNNINLDYSEIIATYVYKIGIQGGQFSYSSAIGLFNNVINMVLLVVVNKIAKKFMVRLDKLEKRYQYEKFEKNGKK